MNTDRKKPCPRCGGLLIDRDVVTLHAELREVYCIQCSRIYQHRVYAVYDAIPGELAPIVQLPLRRFRRVKKCGQRAA